MCKLPKECTSSFVATSQPEGDCQVRGVLIVWGSWNNEVYVFLNVQFLLFLKVATSSNISSCPKPPKQTKKQDDDPPVKRILRIGWAHQARSFGDVQLSQFSALLHNSEFPKKLGEDWNLEHKTCPKKTPHWRDGYFDPWVSLALNGQKYNPHQIF